MIFINQKEKARMNKYLNIHFLLRIGEICCHRLKEKVIVAIHIGWLRCKKNSKKTKVAIAKMKTVLLSKQTNNRNRMINYSKKSKN